MKYHDMLIEASEARVERDSEKHWWRRFKVRVLSSPAGDMAPDKAMVVQCDENDLKKQLRRLDGRQLDRDGLISLGRLLALLLVPPAQNNTEDNVREFFSRSLDL